MLCCRWNTAASVGTHLLLTEQFSIHCSKWVSKTWYILLLKRERFKMVLSPFPPFYFVLMNLPYFIYLVESDICWRPHFPSWKKGHFIILLQLLWAIAENTYLKGHSQIQKLSWWLLEMALRNYTGSYYLFISYLVYYTQRTAQKKTVWSMDFQGRTSQNPKGGRKKDETSNTDFCVFGLINTEFRRHW